jgi:hypothetical protein
MAHMIIAGEGAPIFREISPAATLHAGTWDRVASRPITSLTIGAVHFVSSWVDQLKSFAAVIQATAVDVVGGNVRYGTVVGALK